MKIYEGEHHRRGFLEPGVDDGGVRALRLRKALPRLEMPCVRAAMSSSIGVRLFPEAEGPAQDPRLINEHSRPMSPMGFDSSDDEASTSSGFATLLAGRDPPADPGQAPPGFHEEMAARMGIPRPASAADPEGGS